jgi:spoIIIJ-associated protein
MAKDIHEFTGKTVDEAVAEGLSQLKVSRSDVAVEVLSKGSRGIFGIGSEPARVRITVEPARKPDRPTEATQPGAEPGPLREPGFADVEEAEPVFEAETDEEEVVEAFEAVEAETEKAAEKAAQQASKEVKRYPQPETASEAQDTETEVSDDEVATMAAEMLGEIVRLMGFEAAIVTSWQESDDGEGSPYLLLDIEGQDLGALIGRRGETLASLQYIVRLMVNQQIKQWRNIVVDVEKYKERRVTQLNQLALRMADQVIDSGRAVALEPMPPNERRIVHLALRDHPQVYTQSSGEGERRKVHIVPKDTV